MKRNSYILNHTVFHSIYEISMEVLCCCNIAKRLSVRRFLHSTHLVLDILSHMQLSNHSSFLTATYADNLGIKNKKDVWNYVGWG